MNGRVYDPNLGRFLSVDPVFQFQTNTQSLNPYSYVLNNPLSATDPTGYTACSNIGLSNGHVAGMCSVTDKAGNTAWVDFNVHSNGSVSFDSADLKAAMPVIANMAPNGADKTQGTAVPTASSSQSGSGDTATVPIANSPAATGKQTSAAEADSETLEVVKQVNQALSAAGKDEIPVESSASVTVSYDKSTGTTVLGAHLFFIGGDKKQREEALTSMRTAWKGDVGPYHLSNDFAVDALYKPGDIVIVLSSIMTRSTSYGNWMLLDPRTPSDAAHETGHQFGEKERYEERIINGRVLDLPKTEADDNSLMIKDIKDGGRVTPSDIEMILEAHPPL